MNNPTSIPGRTAKLMKRRVCVLALVLVFMALGVGGVPSSEALAQGSLSMDSTGASVVEVARTETIVLTAASVSPEPSADGWNNDKTTVTIAARMKTH